jgi:hypothetical protein
MKLPIFNNAKHTPEHEPLVGAAEEMGRFESLSPRDRALERWEMKIDQGVPLAKLPVSPRAQSNQLAALSSLPVSPRAEIGVL